VDRFPWTGPAPVAVERDITSAVADLITAEGTPMPGAVEALRLCRRLGLAVAVCSGSYAVVIEAALARLGIESDVSVWHSAEWEPWASPTRAPT